MRAKGEGSIRQRRRADGSIYWEARTTIHGRMVSFYDDSKTAALAASRRARTDSERGVDGAGPNVTVEAYLKRWLEHVQPALRARTYSSYASHCRLYLVPALGRVRLSQLTAAHVERMLANLLASGLSPTTATRVRATLSVALNQARRDSGLQRNVASLAKLPKGDRPSFTAEAVTPAEAKLILEAMSGSRLEPLVAFSIATGVRQGELLALRWQDVDLPGRTVTIRHAVDVQAGRRVLARPKTEQSQRTLRLPDMAIAALDLARQQSADDRLLAGKAWQDLDLVFPGPTGEIRDGCAVTRRFQDRLKHRGIPPIRWHALRRLFAAVLQDDGVPLEQIRDLMGHSTLSVTESYAYTLPASLDRAMGSIDRSFGAMMGRRWVREDDEELDTGRQARKIKHPRLDSNQRPAD